MLTEYSFHDNSGKAVEDAVINPSDQSGINFLSKEIVGADLSLLEYMPNATGNQPYDFKNKGSENRGSNISFDQFAYRGMPFGGLPGFEGSSDLTTFASARDFGNVAAGFVAGNNGLSWKEARLGFDALESYQQGAFNCVF